MTIHAGEGGTDAQDWAEMLLRMYLRWAERRGFKTEVVEASPGEEAGLKSATFAVSGENAYGMLKAERGVHRLVRMSPFDAGTGGRLRSRRSIVAPLLRRTDARIDETDLRIDTYRSSGAGGQHVNVTDSAVRITHFRRASSCSARTSAPSQNKDGIRILKSRRAELQRGEAGRRAGAATAAPRRTGLRPQIRSYVSIRIRS